MRSKIYQGTVWHRRHAPVQHHFCYQIFFLAIDLDEMDQIKNSIPFFGFDRFKFVSLWGKDYLGKSSLSIKEKLKEWLKEYGLIESPSRVMLITMPRLFFYAFNPVNFYYCYRSDETLLSIVVEINSTFGDKHLYILPTEKMVSSSSSRYRFLSPKEFHVSPFNPLNGHYQFAFSPLAEKIAININVLKESFERNSFLTTSINCQAKELNRKNLIRTIFTFPLSVLGATLRIGYQAFRLYFSHKLNVFDHPKPISKWTIQQEKPLLLQRLLTGDYLESIQQKFRFVKKEL